MTGEEGSTGEGSSSIGVDLIYKGIKPAPKARRVMNRKNIIALGLGLQPPREITGQMLDAEKNPHELAHAI
jgi:hypothetical protein